MGPSEDCIYKEARGVLTKYEKITPEAVDKASRGRITYQELADHLQSFGLSIDNVVHDDTRHCFNTYYADYHKGLYHNIMLATGSLMKGDPGLQELADQLDGHECLLSQDWRNFYGLGVPVPMAIYDFQKRMRDIHPIEVFKVWLGIHERIDFSNGMWKPETINYVFFYAPACDKPEADEYGMVEIYRGMGDLSQPAEKAFSWTLSLQRALWFAVHTGNGTAFATGKIPLDDIVYYHKSYGENEILVRPGTVKGIQLADMIPVRKETYMPLTQSVFGEFIMYGSQVNKFDLEGSSSLGLFDNTNKHAWNVLFLSLIYHAHSGCGLTIADRNVMIYFSLFHDIAWAGEDERHGAAALEKIKQKGYRISKLKLTKKDYRIADLIIQYHPYEDDAVGYAAIELEPGFTKKDKDRARKLFAICKDMDDLTELRKVNLDFRTLRTEYAKKLTLVAGGLNEEGLERYFGEEAPKWENDGN